MLLSFTDFQNFKEMMLDIKNSKLNGADDLGVMIEKVEK
jgi:hypothetical protein